MGKPAHTNGARGHGQRPPESPKKLGLGLRRNSFKKERKSSKQSSRLHNSPGHEQRTGGDVSNSHHSERSPLRNGSPPSSAILSTPDTITSKASSSAVAGGGSGSAQFSLGSSAQGSLKSFRTPIEQIVVNKIEVITKKLTVEYGFETAASIDILNLVEASTPNLENEATKLRRGAMLMEEGQKKLNEGKEMLKSAFETIRRTFNLNELSEFL